MDLNAQLSQISLRDKSIKSVLIDFGGISFYQCNIQNPSDKSEIRDFFLKWRTVIKRKALRNEQDIENILKIDFSTLRFTFNRWKGKYEKIIFERKKEAFRTWRILANARMKQKEKFEQKAIAMIDYWRNLAMNRILINRQMRRAKRRFFKIWYVHFIYQLKVKRFKEKAGRIKMKRIMRVWKFRFRIHKNKTCEAKVKSLIKDRLQANFFEKWHLNFLSKTRVIPKAKMQIRAVFHIWRTSASISLSLRERYNKVVAKRLRVLKAKSIAKWKVRVKNMKRKRQRKNINSWARIVIREITYSRCQVLRARILLSSSFRQMKTLIQNKNRKLKSEFFKIWKIFIKRTKQEKDCKQLIVSFQLSRYYGRWQLAYKQIVENREISFVRSRVVETRLKKRVFAFWLDRAIYNFKRRQIRAIKFKRKYIKIRFFKAWYNYSKMIQIRSEEYYKTITLQRYFKALKYATLEIPRQNEEKANNLRKEILLRRYFARLKSCIGCELDDDMTEIIATLNQQNTYYLMQY